jgi:5-methylcytosine-specific restriction endonuclease McrA
VITITLEGDVFVPHFTCDRCGARIRDLEETPAIFEWQMDDAMTVVTASRIVHKGFCCPAYQGEQQGPAWFWIGLDEWLRYLSANSGLGVPSANVRECFECGATPGANHHVVPRSLGGTRTVPLCDACHAAIHSAGQPLSLGRLSTHARAQRKDDR